MLLRSTTTWKPENLKPSKRQNPKTPKPKRSCRSLQSWGSEFHHKSLKSVQSVRSAFYHYSHANNCSVTSVPSVNSGSPIIVHRTSYIVNCNSFAFIRGRWSQNSSWHRLRNPNNSHKLIKDPPAASLSAWQQVIYLLMYKRRAASLMRRQSGKNWIYILNRWRKRWIFVCTPATALKPWTLSHLGLEQALTQPLCAIICPLSSTHYLIFNISLPLWAP